MNCEQARQHWELYYDSEGDPELCLHINEHLAQCPDCARWFFQQGRLEDVLLAKLRSGEPSAETWANVRERSGLARPAMARSWLFFGAVVSLAACLLVALGVWYVVHIGSRSHLGQLASARHHRLVEGSEAPQFSSQSDAAVEEYLRGRVSFEVRCPPRQDAGFLVHGGGVCDFSGQPAAYVVGRVEGQPVSIFILPVERLARFAHERHALGREAVYHCREGKYDMVLAKIDQNVVVVVGQGSPRRLERVVRAYGSYPEVYNHNSA